VKKAIDEEEKFPKKSRLQQDIDLIKEKYKSNKDYHY